MIFLGTGAGKTAIAIACTKALNLPTLFLTHRVNLLNQTAQRFTEQFPECQNHIGLIGDGAFQPNHLTIATVQTIQSRYKKDPKNIEKLLEKYKFLIIDEAHRSGSKQFHVPASLCKNAYYRLALTATPFMKGNAEEDMFLRGVAGDVITKVDTDFLIENGYLARPFFKFFSIEADDKELKKLTNWQDIYEMGIVKNKKRNKIICSQTRKLIESQKKVLIVVLNVKHGKLLTQIMKDIGIRVKFMHGSKSYKHREKALQEIAEDKLDVIVATNIFDEGIDVNNINVVILAAGTKSAPGLFQRTGRSMRKKDTDNYAIVIDFIDKQNEKLFNHSMKRYNMVKNEKGFQIL